MSERRSQLRNSSSRPTEAGQGGPSALSRGPLASPWSVRARVIASVLLVLHLAAIFLAPAAIPAPTSDLSRGVESWFTPYSQALFMRHGYRFFAPDPGPSHVLRYEYELPDGGKGEGRMPDLEKHWPRLLYHRHLMISESAFNLCRLLRLPPPPVTMPPPTLSPEELERFRRAMDFERANYERLLIEHRRVAPTAEALLTGIARNVVSRHGAVKVSIYLAEHDLARMSEVAEGRRLDDRALYDEAKVGEYSAQGNWNWSEGFREPRYELLP